MRIGLDGLRIPAFTAVANAFIDQYMPSANGEYVKVYLYILRHAEEEITVSEIADALELTERDVERALLRWKKEGLLTDADTAPAGKSATEAEREPADQRELARKREPAADRTPAEKREQAAERTPAAEKEPENKREPAETASETKEKAAGMRNTETVWDQPEAPAVTEPRSMPAAAEEEASAAAFAARTAPEIETGRELQETRTAGERPADMVMPAAQPAAEAETGQERLQPPPTQTPEPLAPVQPLPERSGADFGRLKRDEEFTNLLYIVQRYLSRIFSQTDTEKMAYLYDTLGLPAELLEYLAERCAENGKTSLRYYESVAIDWYRSGIRTVEQAKESRERYSGEVYAVMRAFGLQGRDPAADELKLIRKWFDEYGFSRELVLHACGRTILRIQKPSFPYADRILSDWKQAGVRTLEDARKQEEESGRENRRGRNVSAQKSQRPGGRSSSRFHNFEERDDNPDDFALQQMRQRLKQG